MIDKSRPAPPFQKRAGPTPSKKGPARPERVAAVAVKSHTLQARYDAFSTWSDRLAYLILLGLMVEIVDVFILSRSWLERAFTIVSSTLILVGVWGELLLTKRAREIGDRIVAEAHERAAALEKEAAEARERTAELQRLTAWRHVTSRQRTRIAANLRGKLPPIVVIDYQTEDPEAVVYSKDLERIFRDAGHGSILHRPRNVFIGNEPVFGLLVTASGAVDLSKIVGAFSKEGIILEESESFRPTSTFLGHHINIYVGHKPRADN